MPSSAARGMQSTIRPRRPGLVKGEPDEKRPVRLRIAEKGPGSHVPHYADESRAVFQEGALLSCLARAKHRETLQPVLAAVKTRSHTPLGAILNRSPGGCSMRYAPTERRERKAPVPGQVTPQSDKAIRSGTNKPTIRRPSVETAAPEASGSRSTRWPRSGRASGGGDSLPANTGEQTSVTRHCRSAR